jgi:hypothetical protein
MLLSVDLLSLKGSCRRDIDFVITRYCEYIFKTRETGIRLMPNHVISFPVPFNRSHSAIGTIVEDEGIIIMRLRR